MSKSALLTQYIPYHDWNILKYTSLPQPDWNILEYTVIFGPHQTKICCPNQAANKRMLMAHNVSLKL